MISSRGISINSIFYVGRVFCYWLHGSADQLDLLSSSLSSVGDRLSYFSIVLSCLLTLTTSSFDTISLPIQLIPFTALIAPSFDSIDSSYLVMLLSGSMALEIASSWMYLTAEVPILFISFDLVKTASFKRRATSLKMYFEDDAVDFLRYYLPSLYSISTVLAELFPLIIYCRSDRHFFYFI